MADVRIRPASPAGLGTVLAFWKTAAEGTSISDGGAGVARLVDRAPEALILAERGDEPVGTVIAGSDGWRCRLYRLAVHPARWREGASPRLFRRPQRNGSYDSAGRARTRCYWGHETAHHAWRAAGYGPQGQWLRWVKPFIG